MLDWGGVELTLTYHPAMVTADRAEEVAAAIKDNPELTEGEAWAMALAPVCDWDLTDENGEKLPIDAETLGTLPQALLGAMSEGLRNAVRPTRKRSRSRSGSFSGRG